jgi:hypothetical protein
MPASFGPITLETGLTRVANALLITPRTRQNCALKTLLMHRVTYIYIYIYIYICVCVYVCDVIVNNHTVLVYYAKLFMKHFKLTQTCSHL